MIQKEKDDVALVFDLKEILEFQLNHDVQIIRGADLQYQCMIDGKCYISSLTPMHALVFGIKVYLTWIDKKPTGLSNKRVSVRIDLDNDEPLEVIFQALSKINVKVERTQHNEEEEFSQYLITRE